MTPELSSCSRNVANLLASFLECLDWQQPASALVHHQFGLLSRCRRSINPQLAFAVRLVTNTQVPLAYTL